jgi:molybdate transport system ATP-binding protein
VSPPLEVRARLNFQAVGRAAFSLDVDVEFPPSITAILGPTGSGKTTLLGVVAGRFRAARGRITLGNRVFLDDSRRVFLSASRRRVGYVFQRPLLFPHLTVQENVTFGVRGHLPGRRQHQALEWLERVGGAALAPRHPTTLSGGEQQRVALARALAAEPQVVLLDEPTTALDLASRAEMLQTIRTVQAESGVPFLYVCHSPSEATRVGDRALVVSEGQVVQQGTPVEVLSAPGSLAVARAGGFENVLAARVLEHREAEGVTLVEADGARLEMGYHRLPVGAELDVALRAEDIIVALEPVRGTSARNVVEATVRRVHQEKGQAELEVITPAPLLVSVTSVTVRELKLQEGSRVYLLIKARSIHPLESHPTCS